ncbi:hypothetical protein J7E50_10625 [Pedobacter sp. ISL-68]|uniref:hypothetical protein n=1 Tax=unclassified Pedobacter TaxID=2628915 RepID=UPI001BE8B546|nr:MULTISPECIES: hypothetical protein [unclassified Pedobacter]MBT2561285.1 hypothetical protein [Pedobacter sp. ISL-64]MBT2590674.1 hypothetical protein [Pedobacter sp. ISL-68]
MIEDVKENGFGKDIPPARSHVIIWFLQKGLTEQKALEFYCFYTQRFWKSQNGNTIKDWKMTAWEWVWR